jgi:NTE family protein
MRDWRVGEVKSPTVPLAQAVAASAAFPPFLSPAHLHVDPEAYSPPENEPLHREPFLSRVVLTDGGVYDNLGLEAVWKRCMTVIASDGGGQMQPDEDPHSDWARHMLRVLEVVDNQVRSLRKRWLIARYKRGTRKGTYFSIRGNIAEYPADDRLDCPHVRTLVLAETPTRLKAVEDDLQERLIDWGYAMCDAAMRTWVDRALPPPTGFPHPQTGV